MRNRRTRLAEDDVLVSFAELDSDLFDSLDPLPHVERGLLSTRSFDEDATDLRSFWLRPDVSVAAWRDHFGPGAGRSGTGRRRAA